MTVYLEPRSREGMVLENLATRTERLTKAERHRRLEEDKQYVLNSPDGEALLARIYKASPTVASIRRMEYAVRVARVCVESKTRGAL